jgi:YVTN family beta-propeller protein
MHTGGRSNEFKSSLLAIGAIVVFIAGVLGPAAIASATTPVKTYAFGGSAFVQSPTSGLIYTTVPALNEVAVINPSTLAVQTTISIGSTPSGLCLSPDGSTLYVADSGSDFIGVVNTATETAGSSIFLGAGNAPNDVQIGTNGRLWVVLNGGTVAQFTTSGTSAGANVGATGAVGFFTGGSEIRTSSDHDTLYVAQYGSSPSYLYKYDVSGATAQGLIQIAAGGNGHDLELSHNNNTLVDTQGGGNNGTPTTYEDAVYRSSDFAELGSLPVGAYPQAFAFSPDDLFGYAGTYSSTIQIYNLSTYLETSTITAANEPDKLFVDSTGRYLFSDEGGETEVFNTGRVVVPEPSSLVLAGGALLVLLQRRRDSARAEL